MITYQNMTPSQTFEERIVSVINTGIDETATKVVCVTNGDLLRYKTLLPQIATQVYTGTFISANSETKTLTLPTGIIFENIINIDFKAFYNTSATVFPNGICWAPDDGTTIGFGSGTETNPSSSTTFKMFRKTNRMASAPYKLTLMYVAI